MTTFRVWAPDVQAVELQHGGRKTAMHRGPEGWWSVARKAQAGDDYAFIVDGKGALPDPASPWQPQGVHTASRLVDHQSFAWNDARWQSQPLASAIIYELHVGTFTPQGTFDAVIGKLGHLADLGVTHVEIMPVGEFPGTRGWGYDGVDIYAPHHVYGGPGGLKRLVDACHRRGLGVVQDVVYNHFGPEGSYLRRLGPYFSDRHTTPWGQAVNFDGPGSDEVRRFVLDNAAMFLRDYHMDGLRLDGIHAIFDSSAVHILEQLAQQTQRLSAQLGRHLFLIAESDLNDPRIVQSPQAGGYGIDAQWMDDFHHALHAVLTGESEGYYGDFGGIEDLATSLRNAFVYDGRYSQYRGRSYGRAADGLPASRFVVCMQNHDQVGNRARGERISLLAPRERIKIGAALVLTSPFVPMLFMGEEWGARTPFAFFTDFQDPKLSRNVRRGRAREFSQFDFQPGTLPDPQAKRTFMESKLQWQDMERAPHRDMLNWYRSLIRLRRQTPDLSDGDMRNVSVTCDSRRKWLVMQRGRVVVACNFGEAQAVKLPEMKTTPRVLLSSKRVSVLTSSLKMPANSVAILG